jgi:hypothetical protein
MIATLTGCNFTPHAQWATQRSLLTTSQNTVKTLHESKLISTDDVKKIQPYLLAARGHLKLAEEELPAGLNETFKDKTKFSRYMKYAMNVLVTVDKFLDERQKHGPSNNPQ